MKELKKARQRQLLKESVEVSVLTNRMVLVMPAPPARLGPGSIAGWATWGVIAAHVLAADSKDRHEWDAWLSDQSRPKPDGIRAVEESLADVFLNGRPRRRRAVAE